ncbi:hypothetical protein GCM10009665_33300 [Kitasatospora nipponensis]|uniref:HTH cro/C1-type domain-containing protein n=1 Tax=Kitasatospora nipponensis TaxID=258049 RepID=A0ABN1W8G5_9ACTN
MTKEPATGRHLECEQCLKPFTRAAKRGRLPRFCSARCRAAAHRAAPQAPQPEQAMLYDRVVRQLTETLADHAKRLRNIAKSTDPRISDYAELEAVGALSRELEDTVMAIVLQARGRDIRWADIAKVLGVSTETARSRWAEERGARLVHRRSERRRPSPSPSLVHNTGRRRRASDDTQPPEARLASALSHVQRASGKTMRGLATEARVSPSYVSRMLAGTRTPGWDIVSRFAMACGVDHQPLRVLWEEAHGHRASRPFFAGRPQAEAQARADLTAALQGLYLAAHQPDPAALARTCASLTADQVAAILDGTHFSWPDIATLVTTLNGRPDTIKSLWECVQLAQNPCWTPENPQLATAQAQATTLPADSF